IHRAAIWFRLPECYRADTDLGQETIMSDSRKPNSESVSRREFSALSLAASLATVAGSAHAQGRAVVETEVTVKTPDGNCDAAFIHPARGAYPGVLIWPDAFGLRPSMRDFGKRIAAEGYSVLVPNVFYRTAKAPVFADTLHFNFGNAEDQA